MRNFVGWRYIIAIALPLLLASLGVISMTTDLLKQVAGNADRAEELRNREIVVRLLKNAETDLVRLAGQNARWDEAARHVYPDVDAQWIRATWGSINSIGHAYDRVVVFERETGQVLASEGGGQGAALDLKSYLGGTFDALSSGFGEFDLAQPISSYAKTLDGPAVVAVAPVMRGAERDAPLRFVAFVRKLDGKFFSAMQSDKLVHELHSVPASMAQDQGLLVKTITGDPAFGLVWQGAGLGAEATSHARQKASLIVGFLLLVMTGIGFVCWRLILTLATNEERALHQALHDSLTELPNRAALVETLRELRAANTPHVIAYADLDGFKEVNDSYGHQVGDRLLRAVGAGIVRLAANATMASRMGGDEFVVLFEGEAAEFDAGKFADMLLHFLAKPFDIDGRVAYVGASIGISKSESSDGDELEILRRADVAMYRAKEEGKNRKRVYDQSFDVERAESQAIATELRGIIRNRSLDLAFQPVISAKDMRITGVEALARWPRHSRRTVSPDRFIAVAESAGLIDELGELMLDNACAAARDWPGLRVSVNISAVQLNNPRFVERSLAIIESRGIAPRRVEFEITETSLIRDADRAKLVFKDLQRHGIKIALDDFGTGFSSIGYLRTFNFDRIKIDKSIISKVLSNPGELAIVQGTLLVARGLSADVTAEGVEKQDEVAVLKLAGCTELQGHYFHEAMEASAFGKLVRAQREREAERKLA
ncbi:MAG: EAL domain-containing protein [Rhizobiales bacterium]|nr:EAL domain-containing protein [Hyphomicrobiales bacterium]